MAFYSRYTGAEISEGAHILQSIQMILTTRIGSRVMRRDFGSKLPGLVDASLTPENLTAIYAAANEAISRWEPRVRVVSTRIDPENAEQGIVKLKVVVRGPNGLLSESIVIASPEPPPVTGEPETPLDPSTPVVDFNVFGFDGGKRFVFDSGKEFIWRNS